MDIRRVTVLVVAVMALAACAGNDEPAAAGDEAATQPAAVEAEPDDGAEAQGDAIEVASSDLGDILVDAGGMTLYVFDSDTDGTSTCYDDCAANWPPLTGDVAAGDGVDEAELGTTERDDGETQVTYAGQPLYYFAGDQAAGDTNGQGVGDVWWAVGPDGQAIAGAGDAAAGAETTDGY